MWLRAPLMAAVWTLTAAAYPPAFHTVADLEQSLAQLRPDPEQTYRVRDVRLRKGDVSIYLNEGVISFATPVGGRIVAAFFSARLADAGDAEILIMPPQPAERSSLASFTQSPNLDEHFVEGVFFFSDSTKQEILQQIPDPASHRDPQAVKEFADEGTTVLRGDALEVKARLFRSLLRPPGPANEFFYTVVLGRSLGAFNFLYDPAEAEPIVIGAARLNPSPQYQLWTSYRPGRMEPHQTEPVVISNYRIRADIAADLSLTATASFDWKGSSGDGRVISLLLSKKLNVTSADLDGTPLEYVHNYEPSFEGNESDSDLLLVPSQPIVADRIYKVTVHYSGFVIRQVSPTSYFVGDRNVWYPHTASMYTTFDLAFTCPSRFNLVSTGDLVSNDVHNEVRTVHRAANQPQQLAGFNFGEYRSETVDAGGYRIECYSTTSLDLQTNEIPEQATSIIDHYSSVWPKLPYVTMAITPIPGYFGQGFPGLIYLSETAYVSPEQRPADVRNDRADRFFADELLPHEIAHQWWGNVLSSASYRSEWLFESMANYSALELMALKRGRPAFDALMAQYRRDLLLKLPDGSTVESAGPVDFGRRLLDGHGKASWVSIVYEKGTWVMHMLHERLGEAGFHDMQMELFRRYWGQSITNEQFREVASHFVPKDQPDRDLELFFETWVYGTGLPGITKTHSNVRVGGVSDDFTLDVPLTCSSGTTSSYRRWVRVTEGENQLQRDMGNCQLPSPADFLYKPE